MNKKVTLFFSFLLVTIVGFSQTEILTPNGELTSDEITHITFSDPSPRTRSIATARLPMLSSGAVSITFSLKGGDGGTGTWQNVFSSYTARGGEGGTVIFTMPITEENQGKLLTFYQGKHGESDTHGISASGGGGASTAILDHNNTLIALAGGGGGGAAVENYQSDGRPGGVSRSGHGSDCTIRNPPKYGINGTSGENTALAFPKILGESSSFLKVFAGGGGGITANPNNQASEIHSEYIVGKSAEEGGHGGYHPSESFSYQGLLECIPNPQTSFDVPCPTIKTKDISRGGSGYSGGGAGSPWLMDVPRKDNFCTEVMWDYFGGGGGGGGFNGGGAGDRERGGGGGSSYLLPNFFDTALLEGSYVNNPRNGFIQFRVNYDLENPDAVCQDTTVTLGYGNYYTGIAGEINFGNGVSGKVTLDPNAIDGGSTDNGAIASIAASQTEFTCADLGQNEVTLTVTDAMGLTATCTAIVTVIDDHAPGLSLESHNLISSPTFGHIDLGNNSSLRVNPPTLTFVDNCAVYSPSIQQAEPFTVTCNDIGKTFVKEVRASDISGNERVFYLNYSITATPKAYGRNITRSLNNSGTVTITPQDILDTALSGDCDIFNYSLDKTSFNCDDVGENEVTLTVTNTLTNESDSTTVTVTIEPFSTFFKILYVDANSPAETGNGYSWSQAFKTLDQALAIQKCMDIDEIRVASGVYYPSTSRGCENCSSAREYYFLMNTDFELRGSYNPSTGLQDYNSPSILNGDLGVIGDLTDNAYHVLMTQGLTEQAIIDGFVIQNGNASGTSNITVASFSNPPYQGNGGGIYNDMSNAIFSNVYLYNNSANNGGGGMINMFESPKLVNVVFANNHSNTNGGGLYNYFSGPTLINNTIYGNTAIEGGGVYNDHNVSESVVPTFHNTVLYNNGSDITNYLTIINDNSSHNFSENYTGNGFESLSESPFIDSFNFIGDDFIAGTIDDGLVPSLISPLINAGNNVHNSLNTDITGNDRFNDDIIDVGAYEYNNCLTYASGVIYVDANASGANNGSSWADALISLDEALIEAKSCNSIAEILVAGGVYKPNTSRGCTDCTTAREAYFLIDQDIILKGGYNPATGEIDFNTPTILSGDIGSDSNSDNVYHVLITQGLTAKSVIDGFNIVDGNANGIGSNFINSVSLLKNYGGGIYNMNSSPTFQNIVVSNNASSFAGGGIYNQNNSHSKFVNSIISGNKSGSGGGMHNTQSSPTLINLTVVGNTAPSGGGGIFNFTSASPLIHNSVFFNNGADITYFNSLVNSNSSNNFSSNYGGTGFSILNSSPFVDSDNALGLDGLWRTADDGLNPALGGILINMGSNTAYIDAGGSLINDTDIAGNARIYDDSSLELDKIDVGAYEYSSDLLVYKADFTVSSTSGCGLPQSVTFTDKSEKPDTWEWDFGDGNTSTEQNPIHTYTEEGEYTVTLKVTNTKYNTSDTHTKLVAIEVASVDFTTGTPSDCTPYAITFEDASSFSGDGNITAWLWDFGNGNTSTLQNPVHTYTDSGDYSVSLTISTSTGCNFTKTRSVEVRDKLTASFAVTDASCSPTNDGAIDLSVTGGAPPYKFEWSNLASTEDLSNLSKGTYSVKITDASGCSTNAVVTVDSSNDVTPPVPDLVTLPNITAECEVTGLTAPRATDNCASVVTVTHDAVLPIVTQGTTVVTWTYDDGNGNSSTQIQNVIIDDTTAPVPDVVSLPNVTAQCEVTSLNPPTATDNCGGPVTITSNATLPITTQGTTVITWFYDDGNGNITAQNQNIVIQDNTNPIIRAKSGITLKVDALSTAELTPAMIDEGSTDNCGILSQTFNKTSFTKADEGLNNVVYTVTDMNGNSSQVNIVVIVEVVSKILTITVNPGQSKIYGNSDPVFTYTASGFEAGDDESILTGALAREAGSGVGTYALNLGTLDAGPNYTINFVGSDFEITPATLNVTVFSGQQKTYGDPDPGFRFFATGFTNGDFGSIITGALSRAPAEDVGAYPINLGTVRAGPNYIINFIGADFEIIPAPLSITANPGQSKVYGEAEPSFTYTVSGLKNADTESVVTGSLTRVAGEDVGFYGIQLGAITAGNNYTINFTGANFAITEKTLDITVDAGQSKILGQVDPVFTYQVSGFENGDDEGILTGALERAAGESIGNYGVNLGTLDAGSNYIIDFTGADFTIAEKTLTITVDSNQSKVYSEADPVLAYQASGFENGDDMGILTGALARTAGENVGTYAINLGTLDAGPNYTINFIGADFTITEKTLEIAVDPNQSKIYGQADPIYTYQASGFENGDDESIITGALARAAGENVGTYGINLGTLDAGPNYTINFIGADFTITEKTLDITVDTGQDKIYGEADPVFTYQANGFENGDDEGILTGALARIAGENVGAYAINLGTLSAGENYTINFTGANFEITPRTLNVSANPDQAKEFGQTDPVFLFAASNFGNGDNQSIFTGALSRAPGENVGSYPITIGSLSAGSNYLINFTSANFVIAEKVLTITANVGQSKVFGQADPVFTFAATGFAGGDDESILTGSLSRVAGENVGIYPLQLGSLSAGSNYTINFIPSNFAITRATITGITFTGGSFVFDGSAKSLAITGTLPTGTSVAYTNNGRTDVGTQEVTATITGSNYNTLVLTADLTITPADITGITFEDGNFVFDGTEKSIEISGTLPAGTSVTYSDNTRTDVGTQEVTATITGSNYNTLVLTADLTITPADITGITFEDGSFVFDGTEKSIEISEILPAGTSVTYSDNTRTDVGTQEVTATITGSNYNTLVLTADLTITPADITGITFEDGSFVFDGTEKSIEISGTLPAGTSVTYSDNTRTDVGTQEVMATIRGSNYNTLVLTADLTITPADIIGITFEDGSFVFDGAEKSIFILGTTPEGTSVTYSNNMRTDAGTQEATATITGSNFNELVLTADLTITPAKLMVIADEGQSKLFGESDPELTFTATGYGEGDDESIFTGSLSRGEGEAVGFYPITLGNLDAGQNYTINFTGADFEIITNDSDGDGVPDDVELEDGTDPNDPDDFKDSDEDGVPDKVEEDAGTDPNDSSDYPDTDEDGVPDYVEDRDGTDPNNGSDFLDSDGDGVPDYVQDRSIVEFVSQSVTVAWGTAADDVQLADEVVGITGLGEFINLPVSWSLTGFNPLIVSTNNFRGTVTLPEGLFNPYELDPVVSITVEPKPAPQDLNLSANSFIAIPDVFFQEIGFFTVIDPSDDVHEISLIDGALDNAYFEIIDGILFWSSAEQVSGRTQFRIRVRVTDRAGNILDKEFQIERQRTPLDQLDIPNTFTPNNDGVNDTWGVPALRYYEGVQIQIIEVGSGNRVFYTEDPDVRWDGRVNGRDPVVTSYVWVITVVETGEVRRGMLNLLKQ